MRVDRLPWYSELYTAGAPRLAFVPLPSPPLYNVELTLRDHRPSTISAEKCVTSRSVMLALGPPLPSGSVTRDRLILLSSFAPETRTNSTWAMRIHYTPSVSVENDCIRHIVFEGINFKRRFHGWLAFSKPLVKEWLPPMAARAAEQSWRAFTLLLSFDAPAHVPPCHQF